MPPASRGLLLFRTSRRGASTTSLPRVRVAKLPTVTKKPPVPAPPEVVQPNFRSQPAGAFKEAIWTPKSNHNGPNSSNGPASGATRPPLLDRLTSRFHPRIRGIIRLLLRAMPWLPPAALLYLHLPHQIMTVNGPSMSPLLNPSYSNDQPNTTDAVLVEKFRTNDRGQLTSLRNWQMKGKAALVRGMVIVFRTPHDPYKLSVKRVVGLPGDQIQPLPGYGDNEGADPAPVIVPWNHVWVEGDVDDRNRSVDSNWYGPISQNLIEGRVSAILSPWYSPSWLHTEDHTYPAQRRVAKDAVKQVDPNEAERDQMFASGTAGLILRVLKENPENVERAIRSPERRKEYHDMLQQARKEVERGDPETLPLATSLVDELHELLEDKDSDATARKVKKSIAKSAAMKKAKVEGVGSGGGQEKMETKLDVSLAV